MSPRIQEATIREQRQMRQRQLMDAALALAMEDGVDSGNLKAYQSPVQVYNNNSEYGFNNPKRYVKLFDESYLYADTKNDRVIEISSSIIIV